ncbi:hypothetical protein K431DRAFT_308707 [Polychaeton citri CBS 116435]|uniref:Translation initiation factor IF2/IF5 domain-containing protein n=1 Tax=Polychaeton citri CBS 116435 TaxID=1314669 RepID=A0A9P4QK13_9PEZI|nr:hypothetical protein K431DRAFT_308707 [Polychaeton citri CBS 116435]
MADTDLPERKPRKSVAFADGQTIVDANGDIQEHNGEEHDGEKDSAESHSRPSIDADADSKEVDEMNAIFAELGKKKKKKSSSKKEKEDEDGEGEGDGDGDGEAAADDGEVDLSALKKKKKKKPKAPIDDDFEAKLAEAGGEEKPKKSKKSSSENVEEEDTGIQEGDLFKGTGIWAHDDQKPINYESLLYRFFALLHDSHPDLGSGGQKSYKIPPPQCLREGNKKTIFANLAEICKRMKRSDEHVIQFLFAELGTNGSVDGSRRLVIKGRFQQKQLENVLRRYIVEYVTCKTCRSPDTELSKGENRLYFVTCNSCGSRRSVTAIKTGFSAQVGKRKRMVG